MRSYKPGLLPLYRTSVYDYKIDHAKRVVLQIKITGEKMTTHEQHPTPWYLWPFVAIWKLLAVIVEMTGRLVAMIIGIVLMIVGVLISLTIIGAIVGVPLAIVGLLLFIKGIF
jgi:hypothetical protein